jgi:purine-binding chemotaxis protein CheW
MTLIEFDCQGHRFALPLGCVRRVVPSAAPAPLPGAPAAVAGILNIAGELVAVVDFSRLVGFPSFPIQLSQRLLVIGVDGFRVGFLVDDVLGVTERDPDDAREVHHGLAGAELVSDIVRLIDGLCLIVDPERFLLDKERAQLYRALKEAGYENR